MALRDIAEAGEDGVPVRVAVQAVCEAGDFFVHKYVQWTRVSTEGVKFPWGFHPATATVWFDGRQGWYVYRSKKSHNGRKWVKTSGVQVLSAANKLSELADTAPAWVVTHAPTGRCVDSISEKKVAFAYCKLIAAKAAELGVPSGDGEFGGGPSSDAVFDLLREARDCARREYL